MHSNGLGTRIRQARKAKQLKQTELAVQLDVSQGTIANYELGRTTPSLGNLSQIARITEVEIGWLVDGDKEVA
jgi:transcriptional regulator with XRE-family HTH domain